MVNALYTTKAVLMFYKDKSHEESQQFSLGKHPLIQFPLHITGSPEREWEPKATESVITFPYQ